MADSKSVVFAALAANVAIAILKFVAFLLTGSAAMLSETYHSISDTGNQIFLLFGIRSGSRERSREHPFGYGKAQFFYSFLVSVLLFGIAGWESAKNGFDSLTGAGHEATGGVVHFLGFTYNPQTLGFDPMLVNYAVLVGAFCFEGYAFLKARRHLALEIERNDWAGYREAYRKTSDVTTLTSFTEDTVALIGIGLAFVGLLLKQLTGLELWDALAAFLIGILLMVFAVALALENQRLLLGESLPATEEAELRSLVADWDGVDRVVDFRTVYFGPKRILVTADVEFAPDLDTGDIDDRITAIEGALRDAESRITKVYIEPEA